MGTTPTTNPAGTIYERALGVEFSRLHPQLQRFFGTHTVAATGTFAEAGSRLPWLRPLLAVSARLGLLFPEFERNVPFDIAVSPVSDAAVATVRHLRFSTGIRTMADRTTLVAGRLVDVHARGLLLVEMVVTATADGALVARSGRARLRLGRALVPVPAPAVVLTQTYDDARAEFTIDVSMRVPGLGEVFAYRGRFTTTRQSTR
ncbi:DUF4166 domain-containing protein [Homoserinimonas hongtaonis]|uniref:DUF4166 domain-containing protein n=1 Tax=Homoserinimonas hongtaonis TaxID=2079791 RepID=UPI000D3D268A|nr:DUF4166 domain-containing protein [Salinibacterium hongtaonis]AWB88347.1 hypothetical protein C2138_01210 [Salinibacterium hongtaonis]